MSDSRRPQALRIPRAARPRNCAGGGWERERAGSDRHGLEHQGDVLGCAPWASTWSVSHANPPDTWERARRRPEPTRRRTTRNTQRPAQVRPFGEHDHAGDEPARAARRAAALRVGPRVARAPNTSLKCSHRRRTRDSSSCRGSPRPPPAAATINASSRYVSDRAGPVRRTQPRDGRHVLDADRRPRANPPLRPAPAAARARRRRPAPRLRSRRR